MVEHVLLVEFVGTVIDVDFYDSYNQDYKNEIQDDLPLYNPISHEMNHPYTQHKNNNRNNPKVNLMIRRIKQQQINQSKGHENTAEVVLEELLPCLCVLVYMHFAVCVEIRFNSVNCKYNLVVSEVGEFNL